MKWIGGCWGCTCRRSRWRLNDREIGITCAARGWAARFDTLECDAPVAQRLSRKFGPADGSLLPPSAGSFCAHPIQVTRIRAIVGVGGRSLSFARQSPRKCRMSACATPRRARRLGSGAAMDRGPQRFLVMPMRAANARRPKSGCVRGRADAWASPGATTREATMPARGDVLGARSREVTLSRRVVDARFSCQPSIAAQRASPKRAGTQGARAVPERCAWSRPGCRGAPRAFR
jgi:hypothetical protein